MGIIVLNWSRMKWTVHWWLPRGPYLILHRIWTLPSAAPLHCVSFYVEKELLFDVDQPWFMTPHLFKAILLKKNYQIICRYFDFGIRLNFKKNTFDDSCLDWRKRSCIGCDWLCLLKGDEEIGIGYGLVISIEAKEWTSVIDCGIDHSARGVVDGHTLTQGIHWLKTTCDQASQEDKHCQDQKRPSAFLAIVSVLFSEPFSNCLQFVLKFRECVLDGLHN